MDVKNIAVIGASGGIGKAFIEVLSKQYPNSHLYPFSRTTGYKIDYAMEDSIAEAANIASTTGPLDLVIVANGILHTQDMMPEKSIKELSREKFQTIFEINTIVPALIAKYFLPHLNRDNTSIFAALSARVGSISDNHLGGWYAYRSSKAALNMIIKNGAIEIGRRNKNAIIVGLHPGTVDTNLSRPFHKTIPIDQLLTPHQSVEKLLGVLASLTPNDSGKCFAWDGEEILP
ncbi:MAG: SDR family NAD(P)-dependent oxidoreductase [Alphaproteobacteria bacterium]|nr:SDR family NAD(P)-dependent oxidoreductase [Alphaproteobacteria bacterium]